MGLDMIINVNSKIELAFKGQKKLEASDAMPTLKLSPNMTLKFNDPSSLVNSKLSSFG